MLKLYVYPTIVLLFFGWAIEPSSVFYDFKITMDSLEEHFETDLEKKKTLIQKHNDEYQQDFDNCASCTIDTYNKMDQIIDDKINNVKKIESEINSGSKSVFDPILKKAEQLGEINEIRIAVLEFQSGNYDGPELEERINSLTMVKEECSERILISELEKDVKSAYKKIQINCPILQNIPALEAASILNI